MGIRFYCPNGHKLNVKEFLAGQRGICPRCGAKVMIPFESTRAPGSKDLPIAAEWQKRQEQDGGASGNGSGGNGDSSSSMQINLNQIDPGALSSVPQDIPNMPDLAGFQGFGPGASAPPPIPQTPAAPRLPDPFEGAPDVVWYVRNQDNEQFGPMDQAATRAWLAQGKITANSYVWREGWQDWKKASEVFESLATFNSFDFRF